LMSGTPASRLIRHMLARLTLIPSSCWTNSLSSSSCRSGRSSSFCLTSASASVRRKVYCCAQLELPVMGCSLAVNRVSILTGIS
jgi:hypothetical protein